MTPNEMRDAKAREITKAAQGLGWEIEVEIDGFNFVAYLEAENASAQMVEGKLSKALSLIDELGGPELYSLVEEYDLVPVGVKDEAAELDEFVECPSTLDLSNEGIEKMEVFIEHDAGAEEVKDQAKEDEYEDGEDCYDLHEDVHDDPESVAPVNYHGYSPKELHAACEIDDQDRGGIPRPNQLKEVTMSEGYVKTATRIIAEKGFVVVVRPPTKNHKVQRFASINLSHARALRDGYGYTVSIAAQ